MSDYFTDRVALLDGAGVSINVDTTELTFEALRQLNADPVGVLMLAQVERILLLQTQIADACNLLTANVATMAVRVAKGDEIHEQLSSLARDCDLAVRERNVALRTLGELGKLWNAAVTR